MMSVAPLFEKYRPRTLAEVLGQPKAVRVCERLIQNGLGGRAIWLSGSSGTGKTSIARILAGEIADPAMIAEYDSADKLTQDALDAISESMHLFGWGESGKSGRAFIINEAHGLRKSIIRQLLGILERLPAHVLIVFTTTREGEAGLFEDEIDANPLLSRCVQIRLTNQALAQPFAARAKEIAEREGLDGQPIAKYVRLLGDNRNNMRAALQAIESGAMIAE